MGLRLFHITEFAQSLLTPAAQREAKHPIAVLLMGSLWIAVAGNLPLWRVLSSLPASEGSPWWIGICFALLMTGASAAVLTLFNWPRLLKPVLTLLLWLTALNAVMLWTHASGSPPGLSADGWHAALAQWRSVLHWPTWVAVVAMALLPSIVLWRTRLRRVPVAHRLPQNVAFALLACSAVVIVWFAGRSALLPLLQDQPRWLDLLNPFNTLFALWRAG